MPITHDRRPPGRPGTRRRPPRGHATLAPTKRTELTAALPHASAAVTFLTDNQQPELAAAVQTVIDYAVEKAAATARKSERDARRFTCSLYVERDFRDRLKSVKTDDDTLNTVITERFEQFLAGTWTPPEPVRAAHGSQPDKVSTSVILPKDLFDQVDAKAKDTATTSELGYSLRNARQVAIAALAEAYPMPEQEPAE